ncbi:MAG: ParB N-terminal domain-containing protein, partial [Candidatus Methanomethylophilaceae archaeon]|nr:ParB N-terminal domain-containing protein [Candidatus Methanomethylophilaceae archaeon]
YGCKQCRSLRIVLIDRLVHPTELFERAADLEGDGEPGGWRQPIVVDGEGVIIAGHTRYKAALEMGAGTVPVVVASDMTPEEVRAYRLADNKTHDLSEWSLPMLDAELAEIEGIDMSEFGFDLDVEALDLGMDDEHPGHGGTGMGMGSGDLRRVTCPKCGFEFFE